MVANSENTTVEDGVETPSTVDRVHSKATTSKFTFDVALSTAVVRGTKEVVEARVVTGPLSLQLLERMNRYWRAANYLCIGQIYLFKNPLLREPLKAEHIKSRLLGHGGTSSARCAHVPRSADDRVH